MNNKRTYYNNGLHELKLLDSEYIPDGYFKGRLKSPITTLDKVWINNGVDKEFFINKSETIPAGFTKGRLKSSFR